LNFGGRLRAQHVLRAVERLPLEGARILDAGSGDGCYVFALARQHPTAQIVGVEIDREKVTDCGYINRRLRLPNAHFVRGDLTHLPFREQFEVIICSDVLEHIPDDRAALRNLLAALKPGGRLVLHAPGPNEDKHFWMRKDTPLSRFAHRLYQCWYRRHVRGKSEYYFDARPGYPRAQLLALLQQTGFVVEWVKPTLGPWGYWAFAIFKMSRLFLPVYLLLFPLLLALGWKDVVGHNEDGFSHLIKAHRPLSAEPRRS